MEWGVLMLLATDDLSVVTLLVIWNSGAMAQEDMQGFRAQNSEVILGKFRWKNIEWREIDVAEAPASGAWNTMSSFAGFSLFDPTDQVSWQIDKQIKNTKHIKQTKKNY